jgi:hypothetical protein
MNWKWQTCLAFFGVGAVALALAHPGTRPAEAAQPGAGLPPQPRYRHVVIAWRETQAVDIRFDPRSGESWLVDTRTSQKVAESGRVPAGDYDVRAVGTDKDWWGVRVERGTGLGWVMYNDRWNEIAETKEPGGGSYELNLAAVGSTAWIRRFDRGTGRLWYANWADGGSTWHPMGE